MSFNVSSRLSRGQSVIAIAGATGNLGMVIARTLLSHTYRPFFSRVVVLTRDSASQNARMLADLGADVHVLWGDIHDALRSALRGVDVLINALGRAPGSEVPDALIQIAAEARVALYFPSEFGVDHRSSSFGAAEPQVWSLKREHENKARAALGAVGAQVVCVYVGIFPNYLGVLGFDRENRTILAPGSPTQRLSVTSQVDLVRTLVELSFLCMSPVTTASVPSHVHITGDVVSVADILALLELGAGGNVTVRGPDEQERDFPWLRRLMSSFAARELASAGKLDFSGDNDNDLVNPGQRGWKWATVAEYVQEKKTL
ncbi:NAD(P)-binding protein [Artomyces pyxidatus]|uniref:NAD(P)-binding protein n=1 Tax=Artomyces pyxidatus TaxID=48021 RepID=A0ACB8SS02_9AGAM|nr:NAD(P)-binding protein [Artomyces pyxidatus]